MIRTVTRREYSVACDGCGQSGPVAPCSDDACQRVQALGWEARVPIPRFEFLTTWLCPDCQRRRELTRV
jgi:hypothetical protein